MVRDHDKRRLLGQMLATLDPHAVVEHEVGAEQAAEDRVGHKREKPRLALNAAEALDRRQAMVGRGLEREGVFGLFSHDPVSTRAARPAPNPTRIFTRWKAAGATSIKELNRSRNPPCPGTVAVSWHQTGMVHQAAGQPEAAEDAYRKSLAIKVRLGNVDGQASTLGQLGILYDDALGRTEEAVAFLRQSVDKYVEIRDVAGGEGQDPAICATKTVARQAS